MEKSKHYERNEKVVQALKDAGLDFSKLHNIEHHLYCYTEADFKLAIALGTRIGYTVANEGTHEDDRGAFWSLDLVKKSTPDITSIEKRPLRSSGSPKRQTPTMTDGEPRLNNSRVTGEGAERWADRRVAIFATEGASSR